MTKPLPIETVLKKHMCTGCGACAAMTDGRVPMRETRDVGRRPDFSAYPQGLRDPGLAALCPAQDQTDRSTGQGRTQDAFGEVLAVYEGYAADPDIRFQGSSGGAVTALALASLDAEDTSGVLHVKASVADPQTNEAAISRNCDALLAGAGSRYAPASVADAVPSIKGEAGHTTIIGKPCDIAAVHAVADQDALVAASLGATISIFCAGTPSHKGTDRLLETLGAAGRKLESIRYRGHGWPGSMTARWQDLDGQDKQAGVSYEEGWGQVLQKHRQWRCYVCADHTGEQADLAVGDPWQRPSGQDGHGRSLIVVRTKKGAALLAAAVAAGHLVAESVPQDTILKAQPNLEAAKGNAFGRSLAMRFAGLPAPALTRDMWACFKRLSVKVQVQSIVGTWKRLRRKSLFDDYIPDWRDDRAPTTPVHKAVK